MANVEKILTMVDLCGGPEKHAAYCNVAKKILPRGIDADRYLAMEAQVAKQCAAGNVDKSSIMPCLHNAVKLGLNPDPALGQIYFVPYKGKLTYQIGYKGLIELARRSGTISDMRAYLVYPGDVWSFWEDERGQHYRYEPVYRAGADRKTEMLAVSIADLDGRSVAHIMERERLDAIKEMVLARTPSSPWANPLFETEMRKKTVMRRHCKTLPMSPELARAVEDDEAAERGDRQTAKHEELDGILEQVETATAPEMAAPAAEQAPTPAPTRRGRPARQAAATAPAPAPQDAPAPVPEPEPAPEPVVEQAPAGAAQSENDMW